MTTAQHGGVASANESAFEVAGAVCSGIDESLSADDVSVDSSISTGFRELSPSWAKPQNLEAEERARGDLIEAARKRAVLASQIACHHFRLLAALKAAAEYARRKDDLNAFEDLDYQRTVVAAFSRWVSSEADNAHAEWLSLRDSRSA